MALYILALTNSRLKVTKIRFDRRTSAEQEARRSIQDGESILATVFEDNGFLGMRQVYRIGKGRKRASKRM